MAYILAYDIGTTGVKTCLFRVDKAIKLIADASEGYELYTFPDGGAEQHADEWWDAMISSTKALFRSTDVKPEKVDGITFCSQMQGLVLVDEEGNAVRHPMSYMDQRASQEMHDGIGSGAVKVSGMNAGKLVRSLQITGAVSGSVKDPMWRYLWIKKHEPEFFSKVRWWLDVKEYLIGRMTGKYIMTEDSAYSTFLYDTREKTRGWSADICNMFGVNIVHLPPVIKTTDVAGELREKQAAELGLKAGIKVFGGGGDASLIGVGAGCVRSGDTHIYCGTSGWVSTVVEKQIVDVVSMIAAAVGAQEGKYNYFAEMETAGKCLEWVKDHLALDEIGIYLNKEEISENRETVYRSLYDYMSKIIDSCPPGAGGVIFTPWLHGNRCPFEDHNASGMFFNISLNTGKTQLIRAVTEGVCFHLRWMLECQDKKIRTSEVIRFVGGGALSPSTCQILSDIIGRPVDTVGSPQNVGSQGAALTAAVGMGILDNMDAIHDMVEVKKTYFPNRANKVVYDNYFRVFKNLYTANKKNFAMMNGK